jgi:glycosyltransferase involved in cell wall biosynthesis
MFDLKEQLEQKGHEIIPFSIKSKKNIPTKYEKYFSNPIGGQDEAFYDNLKKTSKTVLDILSRLFYSFHVRKRLELLIKTTKPEIALLLVHYNKLSPSVIDACKKNNLPIVVRLSDYFLVCPAATLTNGKGELCKACIEKNFLQCISNKCIKDSYTASFLKATAISLQSKVLKIYNNVDAFICTNDFMKSTMIEKGYPEKKLHVIPTFKQKPINTHFYSVQKYILYFGRFGKEKAIDTLIYSFLKSELYKKDIHLYLIGGNKKDIILNISQDQMKIVNKYCQFFDFMEKESLNKYIRESLFVVQPSKWFENFPNTILEAFSLNKTVITANIGSLKLMVPDNVGMLYEYEDINDLAFKMKELSKNDVRLALEKNIPEHFKQYSFKNHYDKLMAIFNSFTQ